MKVETMNDKEHKLGLPFEYQQMPEYFDAHNVSEQTAAKNAVVEKLLKGTKENKRGRISTSYKLTANLRQLVGSRDATPLFVGSRDATPLFIFYVFFVSSCFRF